MTTSDLTLPLDLIAIYAGSVTSANISNIFTFSLRHQLINRPKLFAHLTFFDPANIAATTHAFTMGNAHCRSRTLGAELTSKSHPIQLGCL